MGIFEVTLLPESGQNGSALPLQLDQSTVLQYVLHQSLLVNHALLHSLEGALRKSCWTRWTYWFSHFVQQINPSGQAERFLFDCQYTPVCCPSSEPHPASRWLCGGDPRPRAGQTQMGRVSKERNVEISKYWAGKIKRVQRYCSDLTASPGVAPSNHSGCGWVIHRNGNSADSHPLAWTRPSSMSPLRSATELYSVTFLLGTFKTAYWYQDNPCYFHEVTSQQFSISSYWFKESTFSSNWPGFQETSPAKVCSLCPPPVQHCWLPGETAPTTVYSPINT